MTGGGRASRRRSPPDAAPPGSPTVRVAVWARPGASSDSVEWDPWRHRWVIACRAVPSEGAANQAIVRLLAGWLDVPRERVRVVAGHRVRAKEITVEGVTDADLTDRLRRAATPRPADP